MATTRVLAMNSNVPVCGGIFGHKSSKRNKFRGKRHNQHWCHSEQMEAISKRRERANEAEHVVVDNEQNRRSKETANVAKDARQLLGSQIDSQEVASESWRL